MAPWTSPLLEDGETEIVVRLRQAGIEAHRLGILGDGLLDPPLQVKGIPQDRCAPGRSRASRPAARKNGWPPRRSALPDQRGGEAALRLRDARPETHHFRNG